MTTPAAFDPRTAGWSWGDLGITEAEAQKVQVSAEVEAYSAKKDPVRSGKILTLAAPSPVLRLPDAFTRFGVAFGVVDGYGTRGYLPMTGRGGLINHWIVSTYTGVARRQTLGLIINGHSTLAGPLANLYIDFDGHVLIVAALAGWMSLTTGLLLNEGSAALIILNGLRMLRPGRGETRSMATD